ncbi:MAG TPA: hypothetical protein PK431_17105, partial [Chitinophagales bacterium]|nr:hypothetical protein [Chitinophagales bacterium]
VGNNDFGQIGDGTNANTINTPKKVMNDVRLFSVGASHTVVQNNNNDLLSTGLNLQGQLGIGSMSNQSAFTVLNFP